MNDLNTIIYCYGCDKLFINENKPFLLICGHNLCGECLTVNKNKTMYCLICLEQHNDEQIINISANYLLSDVIQKLISINIIELPLEQNNLRSNYEFICLNCNMIMANMKYHRDYFPIHKIVDYNKYKSQNEKRKFNLINNFNEKYLIDANLENMIDIYCDDIFDKIDNEIKDKINILEKTSDKYDSECLSVLNLMEIITSDELNKINNIADNSIKSDNIEIQNLKNLTEIKKLKESKLINLKDKFENIVSDINQYSKEVLVKELSKESDHIIKNYLDISMKHKSSISTQMCIAKKSNDLLKIFLYDIIIQKEYIIELYIEDMYDKNNISVCSNGTNSLFITFSYYLFILQLNDEFKFSSLEKSIRLNFTRDDHISIYYDDKIFIIAGDESMKKVEYFDLNNGFWINLPDLPKEVEHPRAIINENKLIVFNYLHECYYLILNNNSKLCSTWNEIKLFYSDIIISTKLKYYSILEINDKEANNKLTLKIYGGYYEDIEICYNNIYYIIDLEQGKITGFIDEKKLSTKYNNSYFIYYNDLKGNIIENKDATLNACLFN